MKLNVKGLVFVGFAAAILSGAAKADDKQIVTSKSFTEATYEKLANKLEQSTEANAPAALLGNTNIDNTHYPTSLAVKAAIQKSQSDTTYTADEETIHLDEDNEFSAKTGAIAENSDDLVKSGVIYTALSGKQPIAATDGTYKVGKDGDWKKLTDSADATLRAGTGNDADKVYIDVTKMTDSSFTNVNGGTDADNTKVPTASVVKTYADTKQPITASNAQFQVGGASGAWKEIKTDSYSSFTDGTGTDAGKAVFTINAMTDGNFADVNGDAQHQADNGKLPTASAVKTYVDAQISATTYDADGTTITLDPSTNTFSATAGSVASGNTGLINGGQVYSALALGTMPTNCKTGTKTCALVATGGGDGGTTTFAWVEMAQ